LGQTPLPVPIPTPGTASAPFQHIGHAWTVAQANNLNNEATTVNLEAGTYRESVSMNSEKGATSALINIQPASAPLGKSSGVAEPFTPAGRLLRQ